MDLSTNGYLAATQRTNATHSTKVLPNTRFEVAFSSWQWRTNCKAAGKSLWLQLGEEVFKA